MSSERSGEEFQQATKYMRGRMPGGYLDFRTQPDVCKRYPDALQIALEPPVTAGGRGLWDALRERRSVRNYGAAPLSLAELGQLLWASTGVSHSIAGYALRTAPSAGALYPIETYVAVHRVEGLEQGVYHYSIPDHTLERLYLGDVRLVTARAALDQAIAGEADAVVMWSAVFGRSMWKYGQRAFRYAYLDAGHIAENLALAAVALGLGSCHIAALYDDEANALLDIDGEEESVIYMTTLGRLT